MIYVVLMVNLVAMVCSAVAAVMNFGDGDMVMGVCMAMLFIVNMGLFITNLMR